MNTHYFELKAIPHTELLQSEVLAHLMQQLHRQLPAYGGQIGISFPAYGQQRTLGDIIRIFGTEAHLTQLHQQLYQQQEVKNYGLISNINPVPAHINKHYCYQRQHIKGTSDLRRAEKRLSAQQLPPEEIQQRLQNKLNKMGNCQLPHLHFKSASTQQTMTLFIKRTMKLKEHHGTYNSYGLSNNATVPDF